MLLRNVHSFIMRYVGAALIANWFSLLSCPKRKLPFLPFLNLILLVCTLLNCRRNTRKYIGMQLPEVTQSYYDQGP